MKEWIVTGRVPQGVAAYAMSGTSLQLSAQGPDRQQALAQLDLPHGLLIDIGEGQPAVLPAPVLPVDGLNLPALMQKSPEDVISGWVRLWIAGFLKERPHWDGIVCALHGDVAHWMHISAEEVVSSLSSLTPRLYAALGMQITDPDPQAIADALSHPERLATLLREAEIRGDPAACLGYFLGVDLAATRAYWLGQNVAVIGDGEMAEAYQQALAGQGAPVETAAPDDVLSAGLAALGSALGFA